MIHAIVKNGVIEHLVSIPEGGNLNDLDFLTEDQRARAVEISKEAGRPSVGQKYVDGNLIDPAAPPPPSPNVISAISELRNGIQVESLSTPELNGTYSTDIITQIRLIQAVLKSLIEGRLKNPCNLKDANGFSHTFTALQIKELFITLLQRITLLEAIARGEEEELPIEPIKIS